MAVTILRPNQEFTVKANVTRGDTQLVSWIIFSGHNSEPMNILQFYPKNGAELNHQFPDEGKFRLAAYHKEIQTKEDFQGSAELKHVDVEIKYNQLDGSKLAPKNSGEFLAGDALRKDFPAVFEAKFLISPPSQEEIGRLQFVLEDGSGNILNEGSYASNVFTFIPRNSNAKYTVKAIYTKESGETSQQIFSGISKAISVRDITHGAEIVRPGTSMTFSVTQTQFGSVSSNSNFPEQGNIKWNLDKVLIGTGRSVTISGSQLMQKKKYHIEAYATSAIGNTKGSNTDNTKNDWHFEVKDNIVESIKVVKKPKFGIEGEFEIGKMTFPNYDPAKDGEISWKITGPESGIGSEAQFKKLFSVPGEYTISCSLGGRACKELLKISILQPEVTVDKCKWIDTDNGSGNIITEAGINQEVCAFVSGNALDNESLTLTVYDDDSTGRTSVYNMTFSTEDKHKTGFYLPITISQDVVDGIKKSGFADYGDLYFNITRNGSELPVKNGDKKLGQFLRVSLEPKIINAYFCDANDTYQLFNSPLNGALYFKIYAINLVGRKAEINFVTESDAYWSWDDEMKIGPWEDIKNKFKNERIRDTKPGTFNEKGEILVPVDLSKMGKPKNFIRLNAMVKILPDENAKEKQEEKGFYMKYINLAILFPGATLPTIVENKGAVKVGRENIDGGNHEESTCPRCKDKITVQHLNETIGDTFDQEYRKRIVGYINQFIEERKGKSNELNLNTCLLKAHFISQISTETGLLKSKLTEGNTPPYYSKDNIQGLWPGKYQDMVNDGTLETVAAERPQKKLLNYVYGRKNGNKGGEDGWNYRGKGLIQLTGRTNYNSASTYLKNVFPDKYVDFEANYDKPAEEMYAVLSAIAFWEGKKVYAVAKDKKDVSGVVDVRTIINYHDRENSHAQTYFKNAIKAFKVNDCTPVDLNAKDIITYRVYWNNDEKGKIEKHIPKTIKEEYKNKYKYIYHDKNGKEHTICIVEWIDADKRANGSTAYSIPKGYIKTYDYPTGGNAQKAYEYKNGDIYVTGTQYGKRKYPKDSGKVKLVRMKDSLSYEKDEIKIFYSFRSSQRRYCNPDAYAGFIGALAEINRKDVLCTGMCFEDATSYPSVTHPNGDSADTAYFSTLKEEQIKVNAFKKFHFEHIYRGNTGWYGELKGTAYSSGHEDHLHSGEFNSSIINVIEEK